MKIDLDTLYKLSTVSQYINVCTEQRGAGLAGSDRKALVNLQAKLDRTFIDYVLAAQESSSFAGVPFNPKDEAPKVVNLSAYLKPVKNIDLIGTISEVPTITDFPSSLGNTGGEIQFAEGRTASDRTLTNMETESDSEVSTAKTTRPKIKRSKKAE